MREAIGKQLTCVFINHGLLRKNYPGNALVNSAIVSGDLRVSDALPVYKELAGLPVPFVLENEKVPEDKQDDKQPCTLFNRHIPIDDQECGENTILLVAAIYSSS